MKSIMRDVISVVPLRYFVSVGWQHPMDMDTDLRVVIRDSSPEDVRLALEEINPQVRVFTLSEMERIRSIAYAGEQS